MPIVKVNGININYNTDGQGEPLVMIMGFSADQRGWATQVGLFKKHYKVITFDNRGVGKSDKPAGPYTTKMMADDTIGLIDHLGIRKANFLGVSMGGLIAQEIAINYPQRVNKVVLVSTYPCQDNQSNGVTQEMVNVFQLPYHKWVENLINLAFDKPLNRFLFNFQIRVYSIFIGASNKASNKAGIIGQIEACRTHNTMEKLSSIQSPTLVITGAQDRVIKPSSSKTLAEQIPHARLFKIENGSHACYAEMKDIFNREVLSFLMHS
jgi:pimeloyl-ACP methyl ester carboxylesterase